jgi:excisionase family DNA binding protein
VTRGRLLLLEPQKNMPKLKFPKRQRVSALARTAYTRKEIAESLGVSEGLIGLEIKRGHLHAFKVGDRTLILKTELDNYVQSNQVAAKAS